MPMYGVTRIADVTGLDVIGIPVYQAVRPAALTLSVSQGKGISPMLAKVSACMESIELWHAENVIADVEATSLRALGRLPYDPYSLSAVRAASWWHDDYPVEWMVGEGLVSGRTTKVPLGCVRVDFTAAPRWSPRLFWEDSNGLAGGNSIAEATVHALAEVAERDITADLQQVPAHERRQLDLATLDDEICQNLLASFDQARVTADVWYSTGGLGLHCFQVEARSAEVPANAYGAGCHLDPSVALARALTEAAQSRVTFIAGSRDDDDRPIPCAPTWGGRPPVPRESTNPGVNWATLQDTSTQSIEDDMALLARTIEAVTGSEPIRIALPSPSDVPVVRVIAPGLKVDTTHISGAQ